MAVRRFRLLLTVALVFLLVLTLGAALFYYSEGDLWGLSFAGALYWAFITATTIGYGDIYPQTPLGRLAAVLVAAGGIASFTAAVGVLGEALVEGATRRLLGYGATRERGHIVVLGWGPLVQVIIDDIKHGDKDARIVVVGRNLEPGSVEGAEVVSGDPLNRVVLERAGVDRASHIIVSLGDDSETILATLRARKENPSARIIAVINDPDNEDMAKSAGADHVVLAEVLASLAASYIFEPAAAQVLVDMASTAKGEVDLREAPAGKYAGLRFIDALRRAKEEEDAIIIAVVRRGRLVANPSPDLVISEGDRIVMLVKRAREKH